MAGETYRFSAARTTSTCRTTTSSISARGMTWVSIMLRRMRAPASTRTAGRSREAYETSAAKAAPHATGASKPPRPSTIA